ncbi:hypothetical protein ABZ883_42255 [Streptomyces sp. NPDC046977]|uniref:hypothetical protein n=1 Tax=Streptomyces sp. NPDC046977 TaxID=3154703 RepID=UPI0033C30A86
MAVRPALLLGLRYDSVGEGVGAVDLLLCHDDVACLLCPDGIQHRLPELECLRELRKKVALQLYRLVEFVPIVEEGI